MKFRVFILFLLSAIGTFHSAAQDIAEDPELAKLEENYVSELTSVRQELGVKYVAALRRLQDSLTKEKKLDEALLVKQEIDRVEELLSQALQSEKPETAIIEYPPVVLRPEDATLKGKISLSKANVLYKWIKRGAGAEWVLPEDMPPGEYEVVINRSCAYGEGGSYQISVGDSEILGSIIGVGEWSDWKNEHVGDIEIESSPNILRIVSQTITNNELMFIRSIVVAQKGMWERIQAGESIETASVQNEKPLNLRRYDGVTMDTMQSSSGDGLYVKHGEKSYFLRLLFVDAPSGRLDLSDLSDREKAKLEASYFGISPESGIRVGKMAESFTAKILADKEFSAYVSEEDDEKGRRLAMVSVGDKFLSQLLVENGLARIYGKQASVPQGPSASEFLATLKEAEAKARESRKGAWGL